MTITGNVTTRDRVIRRELTFAEGDVFNATRCSAAASGS